MDISLLNVYWFEYKKLGFQSMFSMSSGFAEFDSVLKIFLDEHILSAKADMKTIRDRIEVNFDGTLNEFYIRGNVILVDSVSSILSIKAALPQDRKVVVGGHLRQDNTNVPFVDSTDVAFNVDIDNRRRITLVRNPTTTVFELRDIFSSKAFKYSQHYEIVSSGPNR